MPTKLPSPYQKQPLTNKDRFMARGEGDFDDIVFALSSLQGWRMTQEDAHCHLFPSKNNPKLSLVGVFDGHSGGNAAEYTSANILKAIEGSDTYKFLKDKVKPEIIARAMMEGFIECDENMRVQTAFKEGDHSGCTGCVAALTRKNIVVANTGDSRCVIVRNGTDIFATRDHKPDDEREKFRVAEAGGIVKYGRVNGDLASARSFGDFRYKKDTHLPPSQQIVTVLPDVAILDRHPENELMIIACDGIWDVMSNLECSQFCLAALSIGASVQQTADMVLDECLRKGSGDNMSIIIVSLDGLKPPKVKGNPTIDEVRREMYRNVL